MNLAVLKGTRRAPVSGDVFVMHPPDGQFLFGRVITTDAVIGPMEECVLVYVYSVRSDRRTPIPPLRRDELLIPPQITNRLPWSKGYFELVENFALMPSDRLDRHCFAREWTNPVQYYDEYGKRLETPVAPVGEYGLQSFRTIDDKISDALHIPLSTET